MIRLHSLHISHFRGIREGTLDGLTDVNVLVGRNNSGKTTVVEAMMRVLKTGQASQDILGRGIDRLWAEIRNEQETSLPEWWYRQDQSQQIVIEGALGDSVSPAAPDAVIVKLPMQLVGPRSLSASGSLEFPHGAVEQEPYTRFARGMTLCRPLDGMNNQIENAVWPALLSDRRDKVLTRILNDVFGLRGEGFQLLPDKRLMVLFEQHSLPLDAQGDGTRAALRALMVLSMLRGTLFLMEEPESHQHPGSLERFARAVCRLAREQEVQLVISTHSAECVRAFLKAAQETNSEGAIFHLTLEDGLQTARRLDAAAVETLTATGVDVRFLDLYA